MIYNDDTVFKRKFKNRKENFFNCSINLNLFSEGIFPFQIVVSFSFHSFRERENNKSLMNFFQSSSLLPLSQGKAGQRRRRGDFREVKKRSFIQLFLLLIPDSDWIGTFQSEMKSVFHFSLILSKFIGHYDLKCCQW